MEMSSQKKTFCNFGYHTAAYSISYGPFHKVDNHPNDFSKCSNLPITYENHELRSQPS